MVPGFHVEESREVGPVDQDRAVIVNEDEDLDDDEDDSLGFLSFPEQR